MMINFTQPSQNIKTEDDIIGLIANQQERMESSISHSPEVQEA